jgi:hypothetical protein
MLRLKEDQVEEAELIVQLTLEETEIHHQQAHLKVFLEDMVIQEV